MSEKLNVNFIIEGSGGLGYLGCSTAARYLAESLKKEGIDVAINGRGKFDIVHAHTFGPRALVQKRNGGVSIVTAHSTPALNEGNIAVGRSIWPTVYTSVYNSFDFVTAVSRTSALELKRLGVRKPITVIPNAIDTKRFSFSQRLRSSFRERWQLDGPVVLNVAQVTPRKGIYDFVAVAKAVPDIQFVWVGGTPYGPLSADYFRIRKLMKSNTVPNLKFTGFVDDIIAAYSAADVLLAPTFAESFGLNILESLACGLPVITRDLPVFRVLFGGAVLYGRKPKDFVALLDNTKFGKRNMKGMKCAACYDVRSVVGQLADYYRSLVRKQVGSNE